jgi:DNA-directed RNA polymerase subunit RPC12/RpoP
MAIETCSNCGKPYDVAEIGGAMPGTREPEEITCPHCFHSYTRRSNGTFQTSKLTHEQEVGYLSKERT